MILVDNKGTTFGNGGLEKETNMEKEERCGIMKSKRDNIVFLLLLETRQKTIRGLMSYKFFGICLVHHCLFCNVPQSFFKSNIRQIFVLFDFLFFSESNAS